VRPHRDITEIIAAWRDPRRSVPTVAGPVVVMTVLLIAVGGPPTPLTHLFYLPVIAAAVLWGPVVGMAVGAGCAALTEPGALAVLGELDRLTAGWLVRASAMMLVGWVCGNLTRALMRRVAELEALNVETIYAFVRAIDARDPYTARHSEKVAAYGVMLARALGLPAADCQRIHLAGLLHDVGKVSLERSLLHKPGQLCDDEWAQVREHPALSAHILERVARFADYVPGARHHHERFDGRGYPDGLAGTDIPGDARILAVADAYDAMTSDRSYRPALGHAEALRRLQEGAGTQFDPVCVRAFATLNLGEDHVTGVLEPSLTLAPLAAAA
jgi:HD-GYP domain-containing protein (c-di-GMP phosphodiesterase class II)